MTSGFSTPAVLALDSSSSSSRYALGIFFIFLHCLVWVGAAMMTQGIFAEELVPPFLLTYIGISLNALLLPFHWVGDLFGRDASAAEQAKKLNNNDNQRQTIQAAMSHHSMEEPPPPPPAIETAPSMDSLEAQLACAKHCSDYVELACESEDRLSRDHHRSWNHRRHFLAALFLAPAMFTSDYLLNRALISTSIAATTVLVSTQSVFCFWIAVALSLETFSYLKLTGVMASVVGTVMVVVDHTDNDQENVLATSAIVGDVCAVTAAVFYAINTNQVRKYCPENEELYSMSLLLGYLGAISAVLMAPIALFLVLEAPVDWSLQLFALICAKGLLDFGITDYCNFRAIVLTNATLATVGMLLTIPMAFGADWLLGKLESVSGMQIYGAAFVLVGFLIVNLAPDKNKPNACGELEFGNTGALGQGVIL